jgi:hypothetical protein
VNLDGGCASGVDLDCGCASGVDLDSRRAVEAHAEEEQGTSVEAVGATSWRTRRRRGHRRVCGGEMIGFGFRGSGTLKKKNSSDERG